ncbi:hypothetical protein LZ30DRAFT_448666 [Colletotrichum cereale]|nr:hypothetical protein LZ30DRAFT_448666 [Colletotrichum cereale]
MGRRSLNGEGGVNSDVGQPRKRHRLLREGRPKIDCHREGGKDLASLSKERRRDGQTAKVLSVLLPTCNSKWVRCPTQSTQSSLSTQGRPFPHQEIDRRKRSFPPLSAGSKINQNNLVKLTSRCNINFARSDQHEAVLHHSGTDCLDCLFLCSFNAGRPPGMPSLLTSVVINQCRYRLHILCGNGIASYVVGAVRGTTYVNPRVCSGQGTPSDTALPGQRRSPSWLWANRGQAGSRQ